MSKRSIRGFTLVELMIVVVVIGAIISLIMFSGGGCSDWTYDRKVTGQVVSIGGRFAGGTQGAVSQKAAVGLTQAHADKTVKKTAGSGKKMFVDCSSTRCFALEVGECVELLCKYDHRWNQPDVIDCKFVRDVECSALGIKPLPTPAKTAPTNAEHAPPLPTQEPGDD